MIDALRMPSPIGGASATSQITGASKAAPAGLLPTDFSEVLSNLATSAVGTMKAGEAASISAVQGKAALQDVVGAVMEAEHTLQTAIVLRDKAVAAYMELSRMAI
jgi:flagellar hook-basal body complex protein FliE